MTSYVRACATAALVVAAVLSVTAPAQAYRGRIPCTITIPLPPPLPEKICAICEDNCMVAVVEQ